MPKKEKCPLVDEEYRNVALRASIKEELDLNVVKANAVRRKAGLDRINRGELIKIALGKLTERDMKSVDF